MDKKHKDLAIKIASKYIDLGKKVGITKKNLENISISGGEIGYAMFLKKKHTKIKLLPYLAWWMRQAVHEYIAEQIISLSSTNTKKAKDSILYILEL